MAVYYAQCDLCGSWIHCGKIGERRGSGLLRNGILTIRSISLVERFSHDFLSPKHEHCCHRPYGGLRPGRIRCMARKPRRRLTIVALLVHRLWRLWHTVVHQHFEPTARLTEVM
jgi:hypothetical protein